MRGGAGLSSQDAPPNALLDFFALDHKRKQAPWVPTLVSLPGTPGVERVLKEGGSRGLSSGRVCKMAGARPTPTFRRTEAKGLGEHEVGDRAWAFEFLQQIA